MLSNVFGGPPPPYPDPQGDNSLPPILQSYLSKASSVDNQNEPLIDIEAQEYAAPSLAQRLFSTNAPPADEPGCFSSLSRTQRMIYFGISILCASLMFSFALIFIPLIATPSGMRKFVLLYSFGNVALWAAFAFAFGPWNYMKSACCTREKAPITAAHVLSLFFGIFGVLIWHSAFCAVAAILVQAGLAFWQLKQVLFSGAKIFNVVRKTASMRFPGTRSSNQLPL